LPNIGSKYLSLVKSRAAVTGGKNSNATPAQSPNVVCHFPFFVRTKIISPANEETENGENQYIYENI